jgi:ThiF family
VRPVLKPALCRIWRDDHTLQLGRGAATGFTYRVTSAGRALIDALDGTRDIPALTRYAERLGVRPEQTLRLLDELAADGALDDAALDTSPLAALTPAETARLEPDLSALGLRHRLPGGALRALERRRRAVVAVHGLGRVGAQFALRLAAAGVGTVLPVDPAPATAADLAAGGLAAGHVGRRRQDAVAAAVRDLAPSVRTSAPPYPARPDLVLVAPTERYPAALLAELTARGLPHLFAEAYEDRAVLGPLVLPGRTACVGCLDLARTDRDPQWPLVLARLGAPAPGVRPACDATLAALVANLAAAHALAFLDGTAFPDRPGFEPGHPAGPPPSLGAVIEVALPHAWPVRTDLAPHPDCRCGAAWARQAGPPTPREPVPHASSAVPRTTAVRGSAVTRRLHKS